MGELDLEIAGLLKKAEKADKPGAKDQMNFTDPESRIMPYEGKTHFEQAYNAQAGVEIESRLIITKRVSSAPNYKKELVEDGRPTYPLSGFSAVVICCRHVSALQKTPHGRQRAPLLERGGKPSSD